MLGSIPNLSTEEIKMNNDSNDRIPELSKSELELCYAGYTEEVIQAYLKQSDITIPIKREKFSGFSISEKEIRDILNADLYTTY